MTIYTTILMMHAIAVMALAASLGAETWMLYQLRRAASTLILEERITPIRALTWLAVISLAVVETTGAYLTEALHLWQFAWPKVAFWGVVLVAGAGALTGRRLRRLRHSAETRVVPESALLKELRQPFLKRSLFVRSTLVVAILLLTALKPSGFDSLAMVVGAAAIGWMASGFTSK